MTPKAARANAIRRLAAALDALKRAREVTATCERALQQARIDEERARDRLHEVEVEVDAALAALDRAYRRERGLYTAPDPEEETT